MGNEQKEVGMFSNMTSNRVIEAALEDYSFKINYKKLALSVGVSPAGLHYNINGTRKWNIETWLKTLWAIGALKISDDVIMIKSPEAYRLLRDCVEIRKKNYTKKFWKDEEAICD